MVITEENLTGHNLLLLLLLNSKGKDDDDEEYKKIVINKDYWILPVHSISEESIQKNCSGKHEKGKAQINLKLLR